MASKYQSAIEKLRQKQQKPISSFEKSQYSSAYEKLGKYVSEEKQKEAEKIISASAEKPILQPLSVADRFTRQREAIMKESAEKPTEKPTDNSPKPSVEPSKPNEPTKSTDEKKSNSILDGINYILDRGEQAFSAWNENFNTLGEAIYNAITAGKKAIDNYSEKPVAIQAAKGETVSDVKDKENPLSAAVGAAKQAVADTFEQNAIEDINSKTLAEVEERYKEQSSNPVVKTLADLNAGIMNMLPTVATNAINPALGAITLGATSAPDAYTEARKNGATVTQAQKMAVREAVNQGLGDLLIGGIAGTGKGLLRTGANAVSKGKFDKFAKNLLGKIATSPVGKTTVKFLGNMLGEGTEESIQNIVTTLNERATYNKDAKIDWNAVAYEGFIGSLMGGVFGAAQIPSNYKAYKSDADIVNSFAKAVEKISNEDDATSLREIGSFITTQMDEVIKEAGKDDDLKERAEFIKSGISAATDKLGEYSSDIIGANTQISDAIEAITESPASEIVENTARFVDTVSDMIEPGENAVNAAIDVVREKIADINEDIATASTAEEKRESQIEKAVFTEIDNTLRNKRDEVETARSELTENNLTVPESSDTIKDITNDDTSLTLEHSIQKHTKTNENLHVIKIPSRVSSEEYKKIKEQLSKIGGYYSKYQKAFIIPDDSVSKISGNLAEIGIKVNDGNLETTTPETASTEIRSKAQILMPDNLKAADKVKFTRLFNKWAENESVNITDMTSDEANLFASFASKLYRAGYDGVRQIGNYANLTDEEMTGFPYFLQDEFYNLGKSALKDKSAENAQSATESEKGVEVQEPATDITQLEKGEEIPESNIILDKDGEDYSDKHQQVIEEYANAVDSELRKFIDESIANNGAKGKNHLLTKITPEIAQKIKNAIGVESNGFEVKIEPNRVQHIWIQHGENGIENQSMANRDDIARMKYVLENPDDIVENDLKKYSATHRYPHPYLEGKSKGAKSVKISKKVNGTYYIIEAVPESSTKTAFIVTAYMSDDIKETTSIADDAAAPPTSTAAGNDVNTLSEKQTPAPVSGRSKNIVPQNSDSVNTPEVKIADYVADRLGKGLKINTADLQVVANDAFGGTQAEGAYDVKSMTDAMELGVNKYLLSHIRENEAEFNSKSAADAVDSIREINDDILAKIPTQTKRSDEQISLQQFSTPPNIAYVAAWAANIDANDTALEPSAGIGGLATFAKAFGAETIVNELSERRLGILKNMPFDTFYNENAEQIDNILPEDVKPTVVIMNPPFSSTGGRTKNSTKNAIPHIEQALLRLEDGGRLVAILGQGMANDTVTFKNWWNELRSQYNIRANIGINGENYRKYGTTFDVQLVVIDKTGPQTGETITGYYNNLEEIPALLEGVRNDRTRTNESIREDKQNTSVTGSKTAGTKNISRGTRSDSDSGTDAVSGRSDSGGNIDSVDESNGDGAQSVGESRIVDDAEAVHTGDDIQLPDKDGGRGRLDGENTSETGTEQRPGGMDSRNGGAGTDGQSVGVVQSESVTQTEKKHTSKKAVENDDGVYAEYKTAPLTVKEAKKHPAKLVESSAMSAVSSPTLTYKPNLDSKLITSGALSDAQLENICYAGQAHTQMLPNKQRKGYFIGDGTGVGKGRQLAGIIMDNWNQGRKKAIWISENKNLSTDARRDWADLGGDPDQIIDWEKAQKKGLPDGEGILFIPYSSLAGGKTKNRDTTTLEAIEKWFGKNYDGVIVFDEAHNMGNLIPMKGARGTKKPSQKAIAGDKLQSELPNARVTYASATGATNIENLSYAARLGLWGEGTSFSDANDFISKIGRAGIAAMELVARDMKAMGVYLARSISYDGVVYDNIQHKLSSTQRKMYDGMSEGWQVVLQNFDKAMQVTSSTNSKDVKQRRGQIYGNMQLFYNQVLTSMAMPTVIKDIEKQLAAGKSCVIQLVNTNEAAQDRAVSDAKSEGKTDLDDLDITPRQLLVGYVENAFPVNQYEEYIDDNGNRASRLVLDSNGQPVINRQAVRMKEALIEQLNAISIPEGPLDMLLNHFGADQIAEITGRSGRVLTVTDEDGNEHKQFVPRDSGKANIAETKDFQDGKKRILVFSGAGATGRSFHADKRAQNQQQRIHYVLQPGWKAETAVQGFGRTHRSNQVNTPVFRLVSTDVMGHKRFVTSIARRLDQLGALTKGQRQTGSGVFGEKDNLESPLSRQALREFYRRLGGGRISGLDAKDVLGKMGLDKAFYDEYDRFVLNENIASDITKFLNRILALPVEEQNNVFTAFEEIRDAMYQQALESGELDTGLENVKADKIEIVQDDVIYTDKSTGADTRYVKAKLYTKPRVIPTVEDAQAYRDGFKGIYRMENGSVRAVYRIADRTDQFGNVVKNFVLISPNAGVQSRYIEATLNIKTEAVPKNEWETAWAEEYAKVPEYNESDKHMITGAILPVWNRLPESDNVKAQRIIAVDGSQYLGRIINPDMVDSTLRSFDVKADKSEYTGQSIYDAVMQKNNTVTMRGLYGGTLTITKRRVANENRIEITGAGAIFLSDKFPGIFTETIQSQRRTFIPVGEKGIEILGNMVSELGVRSVQSEDSEAYYSLGSSTGKWGKGNGNAQVMSINELTRQATRIFGVEINTGKIGNKNAEGIFKTHAGTIRTRIYGDLPTIAHELGHWFDKKYNFQSSPHIETLIREFGAVLENSGYTEAQIPAEAIAEYFASYMNDRPGTERKFKPFTQWMYSTLTTSDQKRLLDYSGMTNAYHAADLERRADAQIHTRVGDSSPIKQAQMQLDTFLKNPQSYSGSLARKFSRWLIDDIVDLKGFGKTYDLAFLEKQADSVAIGRLTSAMTDKYNNVVGDSLQTILTNGSINDINRLDFDKYLVACVALDRINAAENAKDGENIGSLVYADKDLQDKDSIIERIARYERENPTFHDTAQQIYGYNRNLMQLAVQSGLLAQDLVDALNEKYPHYVPLYRVMDDKDSKGTKAKRGYANQRSPISKFKGSGRDIYSPIENIMLNTEKFTKSCMRNDVMTAFADYIDFNEDMGWAAEKVTERKFLDTVSTKDIAEKLKSFNSEKLDSMNEMEVEDLLSEVTDFIGDFTSQWKTAAYQGRNVVSVMRGGKREYYEIHDKDLLRCLENLNSNQTNFVIKALGGATTAFKVLTTGSNPIFGVTNVQRDILSGYVSSTTTNNPFVYAKDYVKSLYEAVRATEGYKQYIREGGGYSDAISRDTSRLRKTEAQLIKTTNNMKRFANFLGGLVPRLVESGESASRYAEYKRAKEQGIEALEAIRKSQEITVNFARGGSVVKVIDIAIPYFRASINSMYHLVDVLSSGDKKTKADRWAKFVGINTLPALVAILWRTISSALFDEDDEKVEEAYQTLSVYNRNAYWCYYVGDGQFFRVAKPKDMTVLSTVWERMVELSLMGEKDALYGLGEYLVDSLCPPTASDITLLGTVIDLAENKTYTGAPIVPQAYENLAPELQYKDDTSKISIGISKMVNNIPVLGNKLNISPMKLDYILEDTTGFVGQMITNLARNDGKINLGFANKFIVDSVYSTDVANIFYDTKEKYDSNSASYKHTLGKDDNYSISDVYGAYKYGKIASVYSDLNKWMKLEHSKDVSRAMKSQMNAFLDAVNKTEMTDLDKAVINIADITGVDISDISPYIVIPEEVTFSSGGYKEKFTLSFDEILDYYTESQLVLNTWYTSILESGYSEEMIATAMAKCKQEVAQQMRDRWENIKFNQKYN